MKHALFLALPLVLAGCSEYDLSRDKDTVETPGETDDTDVEDGDWPDIEVDPLELDFGWLMLECVSDPQVVTVTNVGEADLDVTDIQLDGDGNSQFVLDATPQSLAPGESFDFSVEFTPSVESLFQPVVVVYSNDPDESEVDVDLEGNGSEDPMFEETFEQPEVGSVDVLWVVDNSGSMSGTVDDLVDHFGVFIDSFVSLGLDYQLGVVTTDMDNPAMQGRLQGIGVISPSTTSDVQGAFLQAVDQGSDGSGSERGRDAAYAALTEPLLSTTSDGLVRSDSVLSIVVITDEDDDSENIDINGFVSWLDAYKSDAALTSFSAMAGPDSGLWPCIDTSSGTEASPTPDYYEVASRTGGFYTEICDMDFNEVLTYLSYTAAGLLTEFPLSKTPSNIGEITVTVDSVDVPYGATGWLYDPTENSIRFMQGAIPAPESEIVVVYPYEGECP